MYTDKRKSLHTAPVSIPGRNHRRLKMEEAKRVFLYARVSTEEQAIHGLSIEAQETALKAWASAGGYKVIGTYVDAGISARKPASKRPALQRLLDDVRAGKGDMVVFTKLDRWFRNLAEYYKVQEILEKYHVDWKTIHEDYDTTTASGRLKVNIMLSVAQDEADRTSERIKSINEMKRQKQEALTGQAPFGYKVSGKKIIKDPDTEEAVSAFFERFLATGSMAAARAHVVEQYGLRLNYLKAHRMLDMTAYYGRYFDVDGMTPPYITKEQHQKIQSMRRRIVRKTEKNRVYIFSGLISCGECGGRMGGRVNTNQESYFYNCPTHYLDNGKCGNKVNLLERKIEAYLMETILEQLNKWKSESDRISAAKKSRDYKGEISALRSKMGKLKDLYLNDIITLDECKREQGKYATQIESLEKEYKTQEQPDFSAAERLLAGGWEISYNSLEKEKKQEFWRILIKEIRIYPDRHIEYDLNG